MAAVYFLAATLLLWNSYMPIDCGYGVSATLGWGWSRCEAGVSGREYLEDPWIRTQFLLPHLLVASIATILGWILPRLAILESMPGRRAWLGFGAMLAAVALNELVALSGLVILPRFVRDVYTLSILLRVMVPLAFLTWCCTWIERRALQPSVARFAAPKT